jgi:MerR family mercuric resistance operon transcriptional regulator
MDKQFSISQLAKAAGAPTTTVRYYERIGLVEPENRSQGNYRMYSQESLGKLKFIRAAQAVGFTLNDVRALLGCGSDSPCCGDVQQLVENRLTDVSRRLKDARHVQRVLKGALAKCHQSNPRDTCHVLATLNDIT